MKFCRAYGRVKCEDFPTFRVLRRPPAWENFIEFCRRESFKIYTRYFCQILTKLEFSRQIFEK